MNLYEIKYEYLDISLITFISAHSKDEAFNIFKVKFPEGEIIYE